MTISVSVEGDAQLIANLARIGAQATPAMTDIANATAIELRGEIVKAIERGPKTGRVYTHYFFTDSQGRLRQGRERNVPHQASAPGQAPATDGGDLAKSVYFDKAVGVFGSIMAKVGSNLKNGVPEWLEYGTRNMKARPVWRPEAKKAQKKFIKRVERYLAKVTQ